MSRKRRIVALVLLALLGLELGVIISMVSYAGSMAHCWSLQQMGLSIGCGPQIHVWAWAVTGAIGLALVTTLIRQRRSSTR